MSTAWFPFPAAKQVSGLLSDLALVARGEKNLVYGAGFVRGWVGGGQVGKDRTLRRTGRLEKYQSP